MLGLRPSKNDRRIRGLGFKGMPSTKKSFEIKATTADIFLKSGNCKALSAAKLQVYPMRRWRATATNSVADKSKQAFEIATSTKATRHHLVLAPSKFSVHPFGLSKSTCEPMKIDVEPTVEHRILMEVCSSVLELTKAPLKRVERKRSLSL